MSSTPSPSPDPFRRLSTAESHALELMASHEGRHDPAFVERLSARAETPPRTGSESVRDADTPERAVSVVGVVLACLIVLGLGSAGFPVMAAVIAVALVMIPLALASRARPGTN